MNNKFPVQENPVDWKLGKIETETRGGQAVIRQSGKYGDLYSGYFDIAMDHDGNLEFSYRFTYYGPAVNAREVGLVFDLPSPCDRLTWDRKAEYSNYPDDHIGRPKGTAQAHPAVEQIVPPTNRPFALDDHPWGSNDFRSTKRNIYLASLVSAEGYGVEVVSNGKQHVRAVVGTYSIRLHVHDYYGGSDVGTWSGMTFTATDARSSLEMCWQVCRGSACYLGKKTPRTLESLCAQNVGKA